MNIFYTGIGSRTVPESVLALMRKIAYGLAEYNYILRSGGAEGSDQAFETGCIRNKGQKEIYIPWNGFEGHYDNQKGVFLLNNEKALKIAEEIHPAWNRLSQGAKKLHQRNVHQVLGKDLTSPSKFIVCYTIDGEKVGGTRTALILAEQYNIPIFNLGIEGSFENLKTFLGK